MLTLPSLTIAYSVKCAAPSPLSFRTDSSTPVANSSLRPTTDTPDLSILNAPVVTADYLLSVPGSIHRWDTIAYRIEQLDKLERQLKAEREPSDASPKDEWQHTTWNSCRPLDFWPCSFMRPWLWSSEHRTRSIQYHNDLEWPENNEVGRHLLGRVWNTENFTSPIDFQSMINLPNT